ncbi:MAG: helix-hairpin-helix domain-containing protein, partial [Gammaproteobacteria bacterium]|nr:helix-hairpin-helix domain-containing protein [Gammaproteobacteria bacterium]
VLSVAKGEGRKAGLETIHMDNGRVFHLDPADPGFHLLQHIRDESHRFAITAHRQRRGKARTASALDRIDGVGPRRRRSLLRHFGGVQQVAGASVEELSKVAGISQKLALEIYDSFHNR